MSYSAYEPTKEQRQLDLEAEGRSFAKKYIAPVKASKGPMAKFKDKAKAKAEAEAKAKAEAAPDKATASSPKRTFGTQGKLGGSRALYSRNSELRKARRLRKMGFTSAANQVAASWAGSPESKAPAIASPNFMNAREASARKVDEQRSSNERLQRALMARLENKLKKDPDFYPTAQPYGTSKV